MSDAITNCFQKYDLYGGMAERYDLSFGPFGEQDPELGEFFRQLFTNHGVTMLAYSPSEKDIVSVIGNLSIFDYVQVWKDLTDISKIKGDFP